MLANEKEKQVLRVLSNVGHGKGEVYHIGGVAKIFIKRAASNYSFFVKSSEMISYLLDKFAEKAYVFVEIDSQASAESRVEEAL